MDVAMQSHMKDPTTLCRYCKLSRFPRSTPKGLRTQTSLILRARHLAVASSPSLLLARSTVYGVIRILRTTFEAPVDTRPHVRERRPTSLLSLPPKRE